MTGSSSTNDAPGTRQVFGQQPMQAESVELDELLVEIGKLLGWRFGDEIKITLHLKKGLWPVAINRARFAASLLTISTYSRNAMPKGGHLTIMTANQRVSGAESGGYVLIEVRDTGAGMPPKTSDLGLAAALGFVKQSGGDVRRYSKAGVGTTFHLYLPRSDRREIPGASGTLFEADAPCAPTSAISAAE